MKRYAIIKSVEVFDSDDTKIGEVNFEDCLGYKAKLEDTFMTKDDVCYVGKVMEFLEEHGEDLIIEEEVCK